MVEQHCEYIRNYYMGKFVVFELYFNKPIIFF